MDAIAFGSIRKGKSTMARNTKAARTATERGDLYQEVTDEIIALLEAGTRPWSPSWAAGATSFPLRSCGKNYQGINILLLWAQAMRRGYANPTWMTFKQALELGANVKKGEKGTRVVYAGSVSKKDENGQPIEGEGERRINFLKRYTVFNVEQIEGLPEGKYPTPEPVIQNREDRDPQLEAVFAAYGVEINEQEGGAYYSDQADRITMPHFESFTSANAFYATLAHEAIHSTGHRSRLDRETLHKYHTGTAFRAKEELVAEIGAAFVCAALGMEPTEREDHAAYLSSWLTVLRGDKRAIFQAATAAQAASDLILATAEAADAEKAA
jgi:antirestriction protein ArdC